MTGKLMIGLAAIMLLSLWSGTFGQAPSTIVYQGRLADADGPITGSTSVTFGIYSEISGGAALYEQTITVEPDESGIFTVKIGPITDYETVFDGSTRYLEISIGSTSLTPRQVMVSAPYSIRSIVSDSTNAIANSAITTAKLADNAVTVEKISEGAVMSNQIADNAVTVEKISEGAVMSNQIADNCVKPIHLDATGADSGQILKFDGLQWTFAVDATGDVGSGLTEVIAGNGLLGGGNIDPVRLYIDSAWVDAFVDSSDARYADMAGFADSADAVSDGAIDLADIGSNGASTGQIIKWNGSNWALSSDETTEGGSGDIEAVQAGSGLTGGGTSGSVTLSLDAVHFDGSYYDGRFLNRDQNEGASTGQLLKWNGSSWAAADDSEGDDISSITAGNGLTGGGSGSTVTLNVGAGTGIDVTSSEVALASSYQSGSAYDSRFLKTDGSNHMSNGLSVWQSEGGSVIECTVKYGTFPGPFTFDDVLLLDDAGNLSINGSLTEGGADFAEMVRISTDKENLEPADVLVVDPANPRSFQRSQEARSTLVAGIFSTDPGIIGSLRDWSREVGRETVTGPDGSPIERPILETYSMEEMAALFGEYPMAVVGIVPCKVSAENGPIHPGDLLVTSSTPGHAMRDESPSVGTVIGKALGTLQSGTGVIEVLVTLQ